jgi:hypothetical protein
MSRVEPCSQGAAATPIHVVVDEGTSRVLGAYHDPAVAEAVVLTWGAGAVVRSVKLDTVPAGIQATAKELGIVPLGTETAANQ